MTVPPNDVTAGRRPPPPPGEPPMKTRPVTGEHEISLLVEQMMVDGIIFTRF